MTKTCPICSKPEAKEFRPFCSKKCADKDLGKWLDGQYRIPTRAKPREGEQEEG